MPIEYHSTRTKSMEVVRFICLIRKVEPLRGLEPRTYALQVRCSTTELKRRCEGMSSTTACPPKSAEADEGGSYSGNCAFSLPVFKIGRKLLNLEAKYAILKLPALWMIASA